MRTIIALFLILISQGVLHAQYQLSSLSILDKYQVIPAYAGMERSLFATANYRGQWQNIEGMPEYRSIQVHMPVYFLKGGAGMQFYTYNKGAHTENKFSLSYNYVIENNWGLLSLGLSGGLTQFNLRGDLLRTPDGTYFDGITLHNDPTLLEVGSKMYHANYSVSSYFLTRNFEGGLSVAQVLPTSFSNQVGKYTLNWIVGTYFEYTYNVDSEISVSTGLKSQIDKDTWQIELMAKVDYRDNLFGGVGIRGVTPKNLDALIFMIGWKFNKVYQMAYSYDAALSNLRAAHNGSHELMFMYNLNKAIGSVRLPEIIFNPRYM